MPIYSPSGQQIGGNPTGGSPYFLPNNAPGATPNNSQWYSATQWQNPNGTPTSGGSGQNNLGYTAVQPTYRPGYDPNTGLPLSGGQVPFTGSIPFTALNAPINSPNLPGIPTTPNYSGALAGATAPTQTGQPTAQDTFNEYIATHIQPTAPASTADIYNRDYTASGVGGFQQNVNDYQAQLNAITDNSQAAQLAATGQGRGIPEAIIGGQQAQIAKEAAIRALPIAAQLAASQANLALAQQHLDTLFKIHVEDARATNDYQNNLANAVNEYADKKQATALAAAQHTNDQNFSLLTNYINQAQSISNTASTNNDGATVAAIAKLAIPDQKSPTFAADLAKYNAGLSLIQSKAKPDALRQAQINSANRANQPKAPTLPSNTKFTSTQINKGAANAGVTLDAFNGYDADTKNYFVNTSATVLQKNIKDTITTPLTDGTKTADEIKKQIDESSLYQGVKDYLKAKVDSQSTTVTPKNWWDKLKGFFGY